MLMTIPNLNKNSEFDMFSNVFDALSQTINWEGIYARLIIPPIISIKYSIPATLAVLFLDVIIRYLNLPFFRPFPSVPNN